MCISLRGGGFHFGAVFSSVCDEGVVCLPSPSVWKFTGELNTNSKQCCHQTKTHQRTQCMIYLIRSSISIMKIAHFTMQATAYRYCDARLTHCYVTIVVQQAMRIILCKVGVCAFAIVNDMAWVHQIRVHQCHGRKQHTY